MDIRTNNGAQILVRCLEEAGVELLFAYPGSTSLDVHHALLNSRIEVVRPAHEQGGAFMAGGYARRSGKIGVCLATSGPGATNLVTGITDAYMDSIPTVFICCQVDRRLIGRNAFQETDIIGMTRPCVKHNYLVLDVNEIPNIIQEAFYLASHGRPGPIVVDIPRNVLQAEFTGGITECGGGLSACACQSELGPEREPEQESEAEPSAADLRSFSLLLARSHRPCIIAGGGVILGQAAPELVKFAETFQYPVTTTMMGIGAIPENHPLALGLCGMHGTPYANRAIRESDLLVALGVRFSDRITGDVRNFAPQAKIVHVDIDPAEINKNVHCELAFVGQLRQILEAFCRLPVPSGFAGPGLETRAWLSELDHWKEENAALSDLPQSSQGEILPEQVIDTLRRLTKGTATLVTGVGQHQLWTAQRYGFSAPRQFITSGGLGAMGFGLPAAIGAMLAEKRVGKDINPQGQTILIDGDGSFQMNIQELAPLALSGLPLKIIILNNQQLGLVAQWENSIFQGVHAQTDSLALTGSMSPYPSFSKIANAYQIPALCISQEAELQPALEKMLAASTAFLLEILVPANQTAKAQRQ